MTFLPILQRELRTRARQGATYWARSAVALIGLLALLPSLTTAGPFSTPARVGRFVFDGVVIAAFLLCCSVCLLTADAISSERREGTLGLLFLTRVKAFDVMLGKLVSVGLTSLCALFVFLPVLMIPVVAGGVTGGEATRKGVGLLSTTALSLTAGLYASASQQERLKAWRQAVLLLALLVLLPAWLVGMWGPWGALPPQNRVTFVGLLSPILLLYNAGDLAYRSAPAAWWFSLVAITCVSAVLVARAAARLKTHVDEIPPAIADTHEPSIDAAVTSPGSRRWNALASRLSPVAWLVSRQRGLSAAIWSAALVGLVFQIAIYPFYLGLYAGFRSPIYLSSVPSLAISALSSSLIAWSASRFFVGARRTGELELLMSTPLGAERIVTDQWLVLKGMLAGPVLVMVAPLVLRMLPLVLATASPVGAYTRLVYTPAILFVSITNAVLGVCALCWLGLWYGLRARGQASAILWAVGVGTGLPFLWNLVSWPFMARFVIFGPAARGQSFDLVQLLPHLVVTAFYVWMIIAAKRHLLQHLAEPQPGELTLQRVFSDAAHEASTAFRRARHWTSH